MTSTAKPNVILITCHDLGQHVGCYGVTEVLTPHIDSLASEGVRFSASFCAAPQCSPSRAAIATGRFPHANGVLGLTHGGFAWDLHDDEVHLAERFGREGWRTALVGVQHETPHPERLGFDELQPNVDGSGQRLAAKVAEAAASYIRRSRPGDERFFLQTGFFEPHRAPTQPTGFAPSRHQPSEKVTVPPYLVDEPAARDELAHYEASIREVDDAVGVILRSLEKAGLVENTLVIFTSDHGIPFPRAKCSVYDPGLEVPLIMRWPAGIPDTPRVEETMVSNVDYVPTICELLGMDPPSNSQGRSFAAVLTGDEFVPRDAIFAEMTYHDYYDPVRAVRTDRYKLLVYFMYNRGFMDPSQQWRPRTITVHPPDPSLSRHDLVELYDLNTDPLEQRNVADDPAYSTIRSELIARLRRWMHETEDPLLKGVPMSPMHRNALVILEDNRGTGFPV